MPEQETKCKCDEIMAKDPTRHFRGCPMREKYPTLREFAEANPVSREDMARVLATEKRDMPGPIVMEFLAWLRTADTFAELAKNDTDETICAEFFAQRIEAKR